MGVTHERLVSVVDDDESIRESIDGLLRSAGLSVATFGSADEFLGSAQRWTTSCLILDLRMGGMDGLTLQQRLVTDGSHFPVIILTAHGDPKVREQALRLGALAFLPKPFDGDVLLAVVGSVFGEV